MKISTRVYKQSHSFTLRQKQIVKDVQVPNGEPFDKNVWTWYPIW
jgi:hypothetical protein